jgi:molybdopterin molybdotransferase
MAQSISLLEARAAVLAAAAEHSVDPVATAAAEVVPLAAALGRHLAVELRADGPWPATDRSAMDGFAVVAGRAGLAAGVRLPVVGESLAGRPFAGELQPGQAIRIMTGAVVPAGADAVVPVEFTSGYAGAEVTLREGAAAGANIRLRGSEVQPGTVLLPRGRRIHAAEVGALAVLGVANVPVLPRARVAILATGDEVVPVEAQPLPHQVRESNSHALAAQVQELGGEPLRLGIAADEAVALRDMLARGLALADVVVTIGGISKGTHDLVQGVLLELGVQQVFHGIDLKPGKPTFFGVREAAAGRRQFVFGLPGNPASAFTVFDLLVRPLLIRLQGGDPGELVAQAVAQGAPWRANARLQAIPARLVGDAAGLAVSLAPGSPSGDPFSLLGGGLYALVPGHRVHAPGAPVLVAGATRGSVLP